MCNLHWCLHLNCTALSQSELSNFFFNVYYILNAKPWNSCFGFFTDGKQLIIDIICSYDVTGADFENSLHAFGQSEKSYRVQCIITDRIGVHSVLLPVYTTTPNST